MKVTYLDLSSGRKAIQSGISHFQLTAGNWACDCNRQMAFGKHPNEGHCVGNRRYVVISAFPEDDEEEDFDEELVLKEANHDYWTLRNS